MGHIVHAVFVNLRLIGFGYQGIKAHADLALACGPYLVVVYFYAEAHILHGKTHA